MLFLEIIYNLLNSREYLALDINSAIEYKIVSITNKILTGCDTGAE